MKLGLLLAGVIALETLVGCTARNIHTLPIDAPSAHVEHLEEKEFVVPDDVLIAYYNKANQRDEVWGTPSAIFINGYSLVDPIKRQRFNSFLLEKGFSREEINDYASLFRRDSILVRESLSDEDFEESLEHERFHREMKKLSNPDYKIMEEAAGTMMDRVEESYYSPAIDGNIDIYLVRARYGGDYIPGTLRNAVLGGTFEEFFTYLGGGEWVDGVEDIFRNEHPEAYDIYDRIRTDVQLD
ncbi:hypothetical protein HOD38_03670 [archaeon]|jgi:hypothetical protein|nr:hypothetical protein [archaeon]MBT4397339.1 hypothetical protein [archaeon]MBT4440719.1 hypothetical protein [archaeon]